MRSHAQQKAALTRAVKKSPSAVREECARAVVEWNDSYWPDDWSHWQRTLSDAYPWHVDTNLDTL